jgi:hypothetical protein
MEYNEEQVEQQATRKVVSLTPDMLAEVRESQMSVDLAYAVHTARVEAILASLGVRGWTVVRANLCGPSPELLVQAPKNQLLEG